MTTIKTNTKNQINKWLDYFFKLETDTTRHQPQPGIITRNKISIAVEYFKEVINSGDKFNVTSGKNSTDVQYNSEYKLLIIFKIKTINNQIRSISYMQIIGLDEIDLLKKIFIEFWELKTEEYFQAEVTDILFTYKIILSPDLERKTLKSEGAVLLGESGLIIKEEVEKGRYKNSIKRQSVNRTLFSGINLPNTMDFEY